ncbi:MAG: LysR family transcriptional regulator [Phyllobacterium sp.]
MTFAVLDLELLKAFIAVADNRSFTRAATQLGRTQSAVSMQIKRLEERVGADLLHRTRANVDLTPAGEGLLGYARRMLVLNEEAVGHLREHRLEGLIRLGVMDDYGTTILPSLLAGFVKDYPRVHLEMETGLTAFMQARLGEAFDLVIAMQARGRGEGQFLRREQAVWATGPSFRTEQMSPLPVALYPQGCLFRKWAMEALDAAGKPWRLAFVSHSLGAVEAVALQGLAVTVVKSGTFPGRLKALSERDGMPSLPAADIVLHRAPNLSHAATLLADHLVSALSDGTERRSADLHGFMR